ncbi:MAG: type II toxin-antitoxin system RelB/DinJ family antitoxin, partial [Candidatus Ornithomonoglobus sp.]
MANTSMNIRMDSEVKQQAQQIFADMGMDTTTAVNIFLRQVIRTHSIPFEIKTDYPNKETLEAIREIRAERANPDKKLYSSFSEILEEVKNE